MKKIRSAEQRKKIIEAAAHVMNKNGALNISMDEIAAKLNSTKGTLYYYFKSKGELLYAMQMYGYDIAEKAVRDALEAHKDLSPRSRLELFVKTHCLVCYENIELWKALYTDMALFEAPTELKRVITRRMGRYEDLLVSLMSEVEKDEAFSFCELRLSVKLILGTINYSSKWYQKQRKGLSPEAMADLTTRRVLYGLYFGNEDKG